MARSAKVLIKNGTAVVGGRAARMDILIMGEKIAALGSLCPAGADEVVEAAGLLVLPGAVDTHVHFNDEFMGTTSVHDYDTGTVAAAFGGVTAVVDFSNQRPDDRSLLETIRRKKSEARGRAVVDWGVHPVITRADRRTLSEIPLAVAQGAPTVKCYLTYRSEGLMMDEAGLKAVLKRLRDSNGMLMVHAEDNDTIERNVTRLIEAGKVKPIHHARSRPPSAEDRAVRLLIRLAVETRGRVFIVHLASAHGLDLVAAARARGHAVFAETCTHYLVFTEDRLKREDGIKWICSPPLRIRAIQERLWHALREGSISLVSSDDAAYSWQAKKQGASRFDKCPNGIPGIEVRLSLLYSEGVVKGRISLPRLVELVASEPARLFGLAHCKGSLNPGSDADIVLFDPKETWTMGRESLHMAADWSAYEGIEVRGKIKKVYSRGELIIDGDRCLARKGRGRYIARRLTL